MKRYLPFLLGILVVLAWGSNLLLTASTSTTICGSPGNYDCVGTYNPTTQAWSCAPVSCNDPTANSCDVKTKSWDSNTYSLCACSVSDLGPCCRIALNTGTGEIETVPGTVCGSPCGDGGTCRACLIDPDPSEEGDEYWQAQCDPCP